MRESNLSLKKGLDILRCFSFDDQALSVQEISTRLNIPLSTTYRYVETLEERGFLTRNSNDKTYKLGYMVFQIGNTVFRHMRLIDAAIPHMKSLASLSGETVLLMMVSGFKALCIESIESDRLIRLSLKRGASLPLHAGAPSKLLLAYQSESFIDSFLGHASLTRYTAQTITNPQDLKRELGRIREEGFAFSSQEVDLGDCAISAPILDESGNLIAGLAVAGPIERIEEYRERIILWVKEIASKISNDLRNTEPARSQTPFNGEWAPK
ncbi:MAG: IclR family transcriptional regulator [Syntrophaceae bacterium]|jgi:DNA-binding IclR family transcriptional regulator|nr:IclR family transcriptional regulator [Syntrophaceae bacterium]